MTITCMQIIASLHSHHGGPSRSIPGLCDALATCGINVVLASQKQSEETANDLVMPSHEKITVHMIDAIRRYGTVYSSAYKEQLQALTVQHKCNLMHSHGLWLQCNHHAATCAAHLNIPHIISTRGMLAPWAFNHNSWKKKPVWFLWQKRALEQSTAFCATSQQEARDIRAHGFRQPIAVIPNGIPLPPDVAANKDSSGCRYALFIGRIHVVKGLLELVQAWSSCRPEGWKVVIAGPDENGYKTRIMEEIASLGLAHIFEFAGPVTGEQKDTLYRDAELFILPSITENFGIAVAEALAAGTPVITTKGTPWEGLVTHRCGWWVDVGVKSLAEAILQATSISDAERAEMGARGKRYVLDEFSWEAIGQKMVAFYDWILKGGTPPDNVLTL